MIHYSPHSINEITEDLEVIKCLRTNKNSIFEGSAKLYYPDVEITKFIPILGIDSNNTIIENSNSFLVDGNFVRNTLKGINEYDAIHGIFKGLEAVNKVLNEYNSINTDSYHIVNEHMFLLFNPFSGRNAGHDLSILFDRIHWYKSNNLKMPVVVGETMLELPFTLNICKVLLPDTEFFMMKSNTIYEFKNITVVRNVIFYINLHQYLYNEVRDKVNKSCENIEKYKNKKICLIKNLDFQKNILSKWSAFRGTKLFNLLEEKYGYIIINPEKMNYDEIILYLSNASKILVSFGGIMYANAIFFNSNAQLYYIDNCHCNPYYDNSRYKYVHISDSNLDNNMNDFISKIDEIILDN